MSDEKTEKVVLSEKDWELFNKTINNPPEPNTNLKALFSSKKDDWETPDEFLNGVRLFIGKYPWFTFIYPYY